MTDKCFNFEKALGYLREGKKLSCSTRGCDYIFFKDTEFYNDVGQLISLDAEDILLAKWAIYEDKHKYDFKVCIRGTADAHNPLECRRRIIEDLLNAGVKEECIGVISVTARLSGVFHE